MRFLLILIFTISLSTNSYGNWLKDMFKSTVTSQELVERDKKYYTREDSELFSGKVEDKHKNGKTSFVGQYKNGMRSGEFITYFENGQIQKKENYLLGTLDGKIVEFYKDGKIKNSYKMLDGKISDGLFKVYDEEGYVEKLEFFKNFKSLNYYESHDLIVVETGKNFNVGDFFDDNNNFKIFNVINSKTQKPFSGEYIYINQVDKKKEYHGSMIFNFKNGKLDGKASEFDDQNLRNYRGDYKNGMEHGLSEYVQRNGIILFKEVGQFKLNKKDGIRVTTYSSGKQKKKYWSMV